MERQILKLSKQLISIESTAEKPAERTRVLELALDQLPQFSIERFEKNGVQSALVYNQKHRPEKFRLLLNCHLDVVPGKWINYRPKIVDGQLTGVGALDMKANAAAAIIIFKKCAAQLPYPIGLQLTTDEEVGGFNGTFHQIGQGVATDFVLTTEPTNLDIVNQTKGVLHLKIISTGKTAHGAYPWRGTNAIWEMYEFLDKIRSIFPRADGNNWVSTLNLSIIETSNKSFNKIPGDCCIGVDIRFVDQDQNRILNQIRQHLPKNFSLEVLVDEAALNTPSNNSFVTNLQNVVTQVTGEKPRLYGANGTSDARHYAKVGTPGIEFGAIGGGIGSDDEWVDVKSLSIYAHILKKFLQNIRLH